MRNFIHVTDESGNVLLSTLHIESVYADHNGRTIINQERRSFVVNESYGDVLRKIKQAVGGDADNN